MCGLVFEIKKKPEGNINRKTWKAYEKQKVRGQEGFGYISSSKGTLANIGRGITESEIKSMLMGEKSADMIMFHHRFPTSTPNFVEATHPIVVANEKLEYIYYVIHNGVIRNDDFLKREHELQGFQYTTKMENVMRTASTDYKMGEKYNDSESFAIELALFIEKKKTLIEAEGSIAFVCIQATKDLKIKKVFYGRNSSNPLKINDSTHYFSLASDGPGVSVEEDTMYQLDIEKMITTKEKAFIGKRYYYPPAKGYHSTGYHQKNVGFGARYEQYESEEDYYRTDPESITEVVKNWKNKKKGKTPPLLEDKSKGVEKMSESLIIEIENLEELQKNLQDDRAYMSIQYNEAKKKGENENMVGISTEIAAIDAELGALTEDINTMYRGFEKTYK